MAVLLAGASPAAAAGLSVDGGVLRYEAEAGEVNEVAMESDADVEGLVYVYEFSADITPGIGCAPAPDPNYLTFGVVFVTYHCLGVESVEVELADGDDGAGVYTDPQPATISLGEGDDYADGSYADDTIDGGPGDDELVGGPGSDAVAGGDGADRLDGDYVGYVLDGDQERVEEAPDGAPDVLAGGEGDDVLRGGAGADVLSGGGGIDTADYAARAKPSTVTLDGQANDGEAGENDALGGDVESVLAGSGADNLTGSDAPNVLTGGAGNDVIVPAGGEDQVSAGAGNDTVNARDGAMDAVECGDGAPDKVTGDAADVTDGSCETVDKPGGLSGEPGAGRVKPRALKLRIVRVTAGRHGIVRLRGRVVVADAAARGTCAGTAVRLTVRSGRRRQVLDVPMDGRCRFAAAVPIPVAHRDRVTARAAFAGTTQLQGLFSRTVKSRR